MGRPVVWVVWQDGEDGSIPAPECPIGLPKKF